MLLPLHQNLNPGGAPPAPGVTFGSLLCLASGLDSGTIGEHLCKASEGGAPGEPIIIHTYDIQVVEGIDGQLYEEESELIVGEFAAEEDELILGEVVEEDTELVDGEVAEEESELIMGEVEGEEEFEGEVLHEELVGAIPLFDVETFDISGPPILELGETIVAPSFSATYNRVPTLVELGDDYGNPVQDVTSSPAAFSSVNNYVKSSPGDSVTWTNTAGDASSSDSEQATRTWQPLIYTGILAGAGPYTEADIESLSVQALGASAAVSTNMSPVNQYIVHAYPDSYGPKASSDFEIGNTGPGDVAEVQSGLSITNANGVTIGYRVARSDNLLNAPSGVDFTVT